MLLISVCLFFVSSMSLVIIVTVLIFSCIFSILFSSLQGSFTIIILNSLSGRLFISSSFIWCCDFLTCFFICVIFLCLSTFLFLFFFPNLLHLRSPFPTFRVILLLPFDFCPWKEMLVGWFVLISCWG